MKAMLQSPLLWLALSILAYEAGLTIHRRLHSPLANPLLIATLLLCGLLLITGIPVSSYNTGGVFITLFLTPATIALALPIYRRLAVLRRHFVPILAGALTGSLTSMGSVYFLCHVFHLPQDILLSLIPKSVTTPIGLSVSQMLGGIPAITAISIIITGLFGAVALPAFLDMLHFRHSISVGVAIGTSSHAVGTSRAIQIGETEGAMSGLAIGIAGLITAFFVSAIHLIL